MLTGKEEYVQEKKAIIYIIYKEKGCFKKAPFSFYPYPSLERTEGIKNLSFIPKSPFRTFE